MPVEAWGKIAFDWASSRGRPRDEGLNYIYLAGRTHQSRIDPQSFCSISQFLLLLNLISYAPLFPSNFGALFEQPERCDRQLV